jgi:LysM repeat protein
MAAPALAVTGALAATPHALAATPQAQEAPSATTHTITAHLDAVVQPADQAVRSYTVQTGDTLFSIAQRFYGHGSRWHRLYRRNRSKISDPNLIYAGQVLVIPGHVITTADVAPASQSSASQQPRQTTAAAQSQSSSASGSAQSSSGSGSASLSSSVQQDIANGNDLLAVAQYLVENGYSDAAAAGVASCVDGESAGNPESVGSGGGGLIGWTPIGSAAPNPNIITGDAAQDMMTQLADILYYNSTEIGQSLVAQLNSISDPVEAADFYSQNFEKPLVTDSDVVPSVGEQIFSELGSLWPPRPRQRPAGRDHAPGHPAAPGMSRGSPFFGPRAGHAEPGERLSRGSPFFGPRAGHAEPGERLPHTASPPGDGRSGSSRRVMCGAFAVIWRSCALTR